MKILIEKTEFKYFLEKINLTKFKLVYYFIFFTFIVLFSGCAGCPYSFTGASLPAEYKTIGIPIFDDISGTGEINLRENLTQKLINKFSTDNTLRVIDKKISDTILEGEVISVKDDPSTIMGNEKINTRRISITVKVVFTDMRNRKKIWEKTFSNWGDYDASGGGIPNRQIGFSTAIEKLTEDILIGTVSDW